MAQTRLSHLNNNLSPNAWIPVGQVGRAHGLKGWIKINSYTEPSANIFDYLPWHLSTAQGIQSVEVTDYTIHHHTLLAHFQGLDTPEQAQKWVNTPIVIPRHQLPPLAQNHYYWSDLQGLTVYNLQQQCLGHVDHLFATGANDVLVIQQTDHSAIWIPFVIPHIVKNVDLTQRTLIVDWQTDTLA